MAAARDGHGPLALHSNIVHPPRSSRLGLRQIRRHVSEGVIQVLAWGAARRDLPGRLSASPPALHDILPVVVLRGACLQRVHGVVRRVACGPIGLDDPAAGLPKVCVWYMVSQRWPDEANVCARNAADLALAQRRVDLDVPDPRVCQRPVCAAVQLSCLLWVAHNVLQRALL